MLPVLSAVVFCLLAYLGVFAAFYQGPEAFYFWVSSQTSVLEAVTGLLLVFAFGMCLFALSRAALWQNKPARTWMIIFSVCVFYFMGEDQNWGQYYLDLAVPDFFLEHNKEKELNLHNMSSWLNQKPRLLMEIWVLLAGIIVPLGWNAPKKWTASFLPAQFWPDRSFLPLAILVILTPMPERLWKHGDIAIRDEWVDTIRFSELQEVGFACYMLVYAWFIYKRFHAPKA